MSEKAGYTELTDLLAKAYKESHAGLNTVLKDQNLPIEQWRILKSLSNGQGRSMGDLAEDVFMTLSALSKNIDKMVTRALVYRVQDIKDQRRVLVHISQFGVDAFNAVQQDMQEYHLSLTTRLGKRGTKSLTRLLKTIVN